MSNNKRIDAYIAKSAPFARPILVRLRKLVHRVCPNVQEELKWGHPSFEYKGMMMCGFAAFKAHVTFGFWKSRLMKDPKGLLGETEAAMGQFGRLTKVSDLPSDAILTGFIRQAMELNEKGIALPAARRKPKPELKTPEYFLRALRTNKNAQSTFAGFSPSNKREYVEWILDAKTDETRQKRIKTAIEWMAEGKVRNWKYVKK